MHFFTDGEASLRYECFGWWLSDLVDIPKVQRIPKSDVSISGTCGQQSQLDSEGSLTPSHQLNKTDVNQITFDFKDNTTINKNNVTVGNISYQTEDNAPVSPLTVDRSTASTRSSEITVKDENTLKNSACSKQQLVALTNLHSPNHRRLEELLHQGSQNRATLTKLRRPLEISKASNTSTKCLSGLKTRLQSDCTSQVDHDGTGLSPVAKLALSIEHDPDRELDDSRCALLQAFRELDSRVRALQMGARQLQVDVNRLKQDFQLQDSVVTQVTAQTRHLTQHIQDIEDIQDIRYLDDLIFLLQGQLDRITLRQWPFIVAHALPHAESSRELNLVV